VVREQFDEIAATASAVIDDMREIAYHLRRSTLDPHPRSTVSFVDRG
jgi:hypothetical protein